MQEVFVVKIGGETLNTQESLNNCLEAISSFNKPVVLVHGGGKLVTELAAKLNIPQQMIEGRRITSKETMDLCAMVYAGLISKNIAAGVSAKNRLAIGLSGADMNCVRSKKRQNAEVDYGYVGDVTEVNEQVFSNFIQQNVIPVVCSVTLGENYELLNTNADVMAAEISIALAKTYSVNLVYCFEKNGVLQDISDEESVIPQISNQDFVNMKEKKIIADGMIPKIQTALRSLYHGVKEVRIINSRFLENYFNQENTGTKIIIND